MDMPLLQAGWIALYFSGSAALSAPGEAALLSAPPYFVYASQQICEADTHQLAQSVAWRIECKQGTPTGTQRPKTKPTYIYMLTCISGPTCPGDAIPSHTLFGSSKECRAQAKLTAEAMFMASGNKYRFTCAERK